MQWRSFDQGTLGKVRNTRRPAALAGACCKTLEIELRTSVSIDR